MKVIRVKDYNEMSVELNKLFIDQIKENPQSVLGFTTGGTPTGMSKLFADEINAGIDVSKVTMLNLDEYVCDPKEAPYSVYNWMMEHVYNRIDQDFKAVHIMRGDAKDPEAEIERFTKIIEDNPIDLQMLGLGTNAHIGANEPGTPFDSTMFVADSHDATINAVMNSYGLSREQAPKQMYTMGFAEIMGAKTVVLAASGKSKAQAVKDTIEGDIDESIPASYLRNHDNFIFIIDEEAASLLENK